MTGDVKIYQETKTLKSLFPGVLMSRYTGKIAL